MVCKHEWVESSCVSSFGGINQRRTRRKCKVCQKVESKVEDISIEEFNKIKKQNNGK